MPIAQSAPRYQDMFEEFMKEPEQLVRLLSPTATDDSRYFHWDELRHREPPDGLTHREWWFQLKQSRHSQQRTLPLRCKAGNHFWFAMTDEMHQLSDEITQRAGGRLSSDTTPVEGGGRDVFVVRSLVEEAVTSSQLEGASTSRRQAVELLDSGRKPANKSEQMIINNYLGMEYAKQKQNQRLSPAMVAELHQILTFNPLDDPAEAGQLETTDHDRVKVWHNDRLVHTPPDADTLPGRLNDLCRFANGDLPDTPYITPVIRAIIIHFMFGYDHYFADGNGRTARTAFYWSMLQSGYRLAEYVTISKFLTQAPSQYMTSYEYTEDDDGDLTYFIMHQLRTFKHGLDELEKYIEHKLNEMRQINDVLDEAADDFNHRQLQIIDSLIRDVGTVLTSGEIARRYRVTSQTARADLKHLESFGLVRRGKRKNPVTWRPVHNVEKRLKELGHAESTR